MEQLPLFSDSLQPPEYSVETLAYAAGLMDAEGCITIIAYHPNECRQNITSTCHSLYIGLKITDQPITEWLKSAFGGYITDCSKQPSRKMYNPIWLWRITGSDGCRFLELIYPYLKIKQQQAALAIEFQDYHCKHYRNRWTSESDRQEIVKRKESYRHRINSLHMARKQWAGDSTDDIKNYPSSLLTLETRAYTAGFIDGDGCISIHGRMPTGQRGAGQLRYPSYKLRIEVANTNQAIIEWLHDTYSGAIQDRSTAPSTTPRQSPAWVWHLGGKDAQKFIQLIEPFLQIKQQQAHLAIEFQYINQPHSRKTPEILRQRAEYSQQISDLNHSPRHILKNG